ncbi:phosphotransferase [Marinomonas sp.]
MPTSASAVQENLHFLLNEIENHCQLAELFYSSHSSDLLLRMRSRRGYVQTLREKMEKECAQLIERRKPGTAFYMRVEAFRSLAHVLDSISNDFLNCLEEATLPQAYQSPASTLCHKLVRRIQRSIRLVKLGMGKSHRRTGIKLGRRVQSMFSAYEEIQQVTVGAKSTLSDEQLRATLLASYCLKNIISRLAMVGEALIKADLGQVVSLQNYDHLRATASSLNYSLSDLKVRRLALTRSGSAIATISHKKKLDGEVLAVYKEGDQEKIAEEVQGVKQWRDVDPTLAPDVLSHSQPSKDTSALLIEHMPGKTLEALLLGEKNRSVAAALKALFDTLKNIWEKTHTHEFCNPKFMRQLAKRLPDSSKVHPKFFTEEHNLCGYVSASFDDLVERVEKLETSWKAPFSVLIHGDLNVDNLIYDDAAQRIYFIDLHRSSYFDYVQDISVLMVSIYRLQVLSGSTRALMMDSAKQIYLFAQGFAKRHDDKYFELRLAAGLARSFATSTRFIFDKKLASRMHLRARYLLERLAALSPDEELTFKIPLKELYFE